MLVKKYSLLIFLPIMAVILSGCIPMLPGGTQKESPGGRGVFKSENRGVDWQERNNIKDSEAKINTASVTEISFGPIDANIIYIGANSGLYMSEDGVGSWRQILGGKAVADFALNPKTKGIIYVASGNQVFKTTDNGLSWELIYTESRPNTIVQSVAVSHFDTSRIYVLTNGGALVVSNDWGTSWSPKYDFKRGVIKLLINPYNSQKMYVAMGDGLYRSEDEGATWTEILADKEKEFPGIRNFKDIQFTDWEDEWFYLCKYGILKTNNNGDSFKPLLLITAPNAVDISAMGFNPDNINEIYYAVGNVLYATLDGGSNWKTNVLPGGKVNVMAVDKGNSENLYIGL